MKTAWLSFVDEDTHKNAGIVLASYEGTFNLSHIAEKCYELGCNPGGQVLAHEIPSNLDSVNDPDLVNWIKTAERFRLYQREELPFRCVNAVGERR